MEKKLGNVCSRFLAIDKSWYHLLTTWSPDLRTPNKAVETAAIPDENNNVPCPPSKLFRACLAASTVGLIQREYNQPAWKIYSATTYEYLYIEMFLLLKNKIKVLAMCTWVVVWPTISPSPSDINGPERGRGVLDWGLGVGVLLGFETSTLFRTNITLHTHRYTLYRTAPSPQG